MAPPHSSLRRAGLLSGSLFFFATVTYLLLVGLDSCVFRVLPRLPLFSEKQRQLLYSYGVYDARTNPLYRQWLHGYVDAPGKPPFEEVPDDSSRAYGIAVSPPLPRLRFAGTDALGWINARTPAAASVLFVGDSFCYGAGSGTAQAIPALYEKATGQPVYAACKGGYGLPHYVDILRHLTVDAPAGSPERFGGRTVFVLLYMGNDVLADLLVHQARQYEDALGFSRHFQLLSLSRLIRYLRDARTLQQQQIGRASCRERV
jgi:hypothetical protein